MCGLKDIWPLWFICSYHTSLSFPQYTLTTSFSFVFAIYFRLYRRIWHYALKYLADLKLCSQNSFWTAYLICVPRISRRQKKHIIRGKNVNCRRGIHWSYCVPTSSSKSSHLVQRVEYRGCASIPLCCSLQRRPPTYPPKLHWLIAKWMGRFCAFASLAYSYKYRGQFCDELFWYFTDNAASIIDNVPTEDKTGEGYRSKMHFFRQFEAYNPEVKTTIDVL